MDLILTKILSKISFVVFSSHQRWAKKKKGLDEEQTPTAVLVEGLGIDKDKRSTYIVYKVSPDRGYWTYKASH